MTVDTYQKHQDKIEAYSNMICQLKQRDQFNKGCGEMDIQDVDEVMNVSSYPLLESMGFDTDISDGISKIRAATLLEEIVRLHQCSKNSLKYVHIKSKYGHIF